MNNKKFIGISGVARVGKNLFYDIAKEILLEKYNMTSKQYSIAYYLKAECEDFIKDKLNLSVWSEITEEKNVFRPMLVWYADVKRKQTQGRHWIDLLNKDIQNSDADVNFITDVRFAVYERDELSWLKNELNGKLIHISKYSIVQMKTNKFSQSQEIIRYVDPANDQEMLNDPILKKWSNYQVEWEDRLSINKSYSLLLKDVYLRSIVSAALESVLQMK